MGVHRYPPHRWLRNLYAGQKQRVGGYPPHRWLRNANNHKKKRPAYLLNASFSAIITLLLQ